MLLHISMVFVFTAEKYSIMWIYHGWFIHSSIDWRVGYFQFLTITNKALIITISVQVLYRHLFPFLLDKYLEVEWLDHMVDVFNLFRNCFPKWLYNFTFPSVVYESFRSSASVPALRMDNLSNFSCFSEYVLVISLWFNLHFPIN